MENNITAIIELAKENERLHRSLNDLAIVLVSKSERKPIISSSDDPILRIIFQEVYKLKGWTFMEEKDK